MADNADHKKDYYSILGADETDEASVIERRYKRLAVRHHPDRGGDEEEMKSINEAYRVLGDEDSRRAYDATRGNGRRSSHASETHRAVRPQRKPMPSAGASSARCCVSRPVWDFCCSSDFNSSGSFGRSPSSRSLSSSPEYGWRTRRWPSRVIHSRRAILRVASCGRRRRFSGEPS